MSIKKYHAVLMAKNVDADYGSHLDFVHGSLALLDETWSHEIGSLDHEFDGSCVGCESRVHIRIGMDCLEDRDAVLLNEDEVMLFVDYDVFGLVVLPCPHLVQNNFALLGEDHLNHLL